MTGKRANAPIVEIFKSEAELSRRCAESVVELLGRVPPRYLSGLWKIVILRSDEGASATKRRATSRPGQLLLGSYFPTRSNPWIEIYIDSLEARFGSRLLELRNARELAVGACLFHELGHHIAHKVEPTSGDQEAAAKAWARKLLEMAFKENQRVITDHP